jgi:microcystin-dependent protein
MAQPYIGEIRMFGGSFAPANWAFCNGQLQPISENETLFNLIGTTYGGDGQETFGLPDLRGRVPVHQGTNAGRTFQIGEKAGTETVTLNSQQLPVHSHPFLTAGLQGSDNAPAGNLPAISQNIRPYTNDEPGGDMNAAMLTQTGGSQPHSNLQPYLGLSFIISLFGLYPSQS